METIPQPVVMSPWDHQLRTTDPDEDTRRKIPKL